MEATIDRHELLVAMVEAFARGDAPLGEVLLTRALDAGMHWDQVTSAAARGMAARYERRTDAALVA